MSNTPNFPAELQVEKNDKFVPGELFFNKVPSSALVEVQHSITTIKDPNQLLALKRVLETNLRSVNIQVNILTGKQGSLQKVSAIVQQQISLQTSNLGITDLAQYTSDIETINKLNLPGFSTFMTGPQSLLNTANATNTDIDRQLQEQYNKLNSMGALGQQVLQLKRELSAAYESVITQFGVIHYPVINDQTQNLVYNFGEQ